MCVCLYVRNNIFRQLQKIFFLFFFFYGVKFVSTEMVSVLYRLYKHFFFCHPKLKENDFAGRGVMVHNYIICFFTLCAKARDESGQRWWFSDGNWGTVE